MNRSKTMKNRILKTISIVISISILNMSCATILAGQKDSSHVIGDNIPEGTKVYYNGNYQKDAPCKVRIPKSARQGKSKIEIKCDGYETQEVDCHRKISIGWAIADVCFGVIPLLIDFATGAIYKPRPKKIKVNLNKK